MGQRHQAFAIARVVPHGGAKPFYRCIAACHHQWCYGRLPLKAVRRFITLLEQKDNAEIVLYEIASVNGKYGRYREIPKIADVPCPYTAFLLCQSFSVDLEITVDYLDNRSAYASSFLHLEAGMGSSNGDNNDGISVIDVTDPFHPAYCFVATNPLECQDGTALLPNMSPLSAKQYVRTYYPENAQDPKEEAEVVMTIAKLDDFRILSLQALAEAWPREYKDIDAPADTDEVDVQDEDPAPGDASPELAFAIDSRIETLVWTPDKAIAIGTALRNVNPFPDDGLPLLVEYLKHHSKGDGAPTVDLVSFSLSPDQTAIVVSRFNHVDILKLPSISSIDTVRNALTSLPSLRRLHLLDSNISSEQLAILLRDEPALFYNLEELTHPLMFEYKPKHHVNAFSCLQLEVIPKSVVTIGSLPLLSPPQVCQTLIDILTPITTTDAGIVGLSNADVVLQVAMGTAPRSANQPWGQRHVSSFPRTSANALHGEGWIFVYKINSKQRGQLIKYYGFVKINKERLDLKRKKTTDEMRWKRLELFLRDEDEEEEKEGEEEEEEGEEESNLTHIICGLSGFLAIMKEEGRRLPSLQATKQLEDIFAKLEQQGGRLITTSDVDKDL